MIDTHGIVILPKHEPENYTFIVDLKQYFEQTRKCIKYHNENGSSELEIRVSGAFSQGFDKLHLLITSDDQALLAYGKLVSGSVEEVRAWYAAKISHIDLGKSSQDLSRDLQDLYRSNIEQGTRFKHAMIFVMEAKALSEIGQNNSSINEY